MARESGNTMPSSASTACVISAYATFGFFLAYIVYDISSSPPTAEQTDRSNWSEPEQETPTAVAALSELPQETPEETFGPWSFGLDQDSGAINEAVEPLSSFIALRLWLLLSCWPFTVHAYEFTQGLVERYVPSCNESRYRNVPFVLCAWLIYYWMFKHPELAPVECFMLPWNAWCVSSIFIDLFEGNDEAKKEVPGAHRLTTYFVMRFSMLMPHGLNLIGRAWLGSGADFKALTFISLGFYIIPAVPAVQAVLVFSRDTGLFQEPLAIFGVRFSECNTLTFWAPLVASLCLQPWVVAFDNPDWDGFGIALAWTPSWGLCCCAIYTALMLIDAAAVIGAGLPAVVGPNPSTLPPSFAFAMLPEYWHPLNERDHALAASLMTPMSGVALILVAWVPLCLVTAQPGWLLSVLVALSCPAFAVIFFMRFSFRHGEFAPPPCSPFKLSRADEGATPILSLLDGAVLSSLPFFLHFVYAHPSTRLPLAVLIPASGWAGDATARQICWQAKEKQQLDIATGRMTALRRRATKAEAVIEQQAGLHTSQDNDVDREQLLRTAINQRDAARQGVIELTERAALSTSAAASQHSEEKARLHLQLQAAHEEATHQTRVAAAQERIVSMHEEQLRELRKQLAAAGGAGVAKAVAEKDRQLAALQKAHAKEVTQRQAAEAAVEAAVRAEASGRAELRDVSTRLEQQRAAAELQRNAAATLRTKVAELKGQLREQRAATVAAEAEAAHLRAAATTAPAATHGVKPSGPACRELECSICLADLRDATAAEKEALPCAHVFHQTCIRAWLERSAECPVCHTPVR